jgi:phage shock protein PspC (stress-responsive transcriptional regulator)
VQPLEKTPHVLRRSRRHRIIAGVCGGLAEWLDWNVTLVRLLFIAGSLIPIIPGFVVYLILWVFVPNEE